MATTSNAVSVQGLEQLRRGLRQLSPAAQSEMRKQFKTIARDVVAEAQPLVPVLTGAARDSLRPGTQGSSVVVRGGGDSAPYFPWLDFGGVLHPKGGRRNTIRRARIKEGRYIFVAVARRRPAIVAAAEAAIRRAVQVAGL